MNGITNAFFVASSVPIAVAWFFTFVARESRRSENSTVTPFVLEHAWIQTIAEGTFSGLDYFIATEILAGLFQVILGCSTPRKLMRFSP
ncbi:hypothetical protein [Microbacterium oxydans]|uniref:hypothetical protein n=1 Tax=Microbacterium oxydans TaxID=82380 RepID=UPI003D80507A